MSTTDFLGDLILIYRCWVIWQHNYYVVILPLLAASAGLSKCARIFPTALIDCPAVLSAVIGAFVTGTTGLAVGRVIVPMGLASFILPLCTNVMVTSLIIGRIWYMSHEAATYSMQRNSPTQKAMNIIIESGALYFAVQFVFVVTYAMQHPAEYAMILITPPIYVSPLRTQPHFTNTKLLFLLPGNFIYSNYYPLGPRTIIRTDYHVNLLHFMGSRHAA